MSDSPPRHAAEQSPLEPAVSSMLRDLLELSPPLSAAAWKANKLVREVNEPWVVRALVLNAPRNALNDIETFSYALQWTTNPDQLSCLIIPGPRLRFGARLGWVREEGRWCLAVDVPRSGVSPNKGTGRPGPEARGGVSQHLAPRS